MFELIDILLPALVAGLQEKTNINSVQLPYTVGGNEQASDLFSMMTQHINLIKSAI